MDNEQNLMEFYSISYDKTMTHYHQDLEILYVIKGRMRIQIDEKQYLLSAGDFVLVNANKRHAVSAEEGMAGARFVINYHLLAESMGTFQLMFWCNTVADKNAAYDDVRRMLDRILDRYYEKDGSFAGPGSRMSSGMGCKGSLYLNALYYETVYLLVSNFMVKADDARLDAESSQDKLRVRQIQNYIQANYQRQITLNDLASQLYLSNAYLSKYIKKHFGLTFLEYLNNVRLFHAVDELLYTDKKITSVAMDNGYPSSAAFNKAFRGMYREPPGEYRKKIRKQEEAEEGAHRENPGQAEEREQRWMDAYLKYREGDHSPAVDSRRSCSVDVREEKRCDMAWCKAVNAGLAYSLLHSDVQNQLLEIQRETGMRYVRIWDIFSREHCFDEKEGCNFRKLNQVLDFLLDHGMKPYLELGNKPKQFMYTPEHNLMENEGRREVYSYPVFCSIVKELCIDLVNRYGVDEVEGWYFEYWNDPLLHMEDPAGEYYRYFEALYGILKDISPEIQVGGAGFILGYDAAACREIFGIWKERAIRPDFLSFCSFQYTAVEEDGRRYGRKSIDRHYMRNQIRLIREMMEDVGFSVPKLHIDEWNFTVSNRNVLNDSCEQGAYILKTCIDMIGEADFIAYWHGLDLYSEYYDSDAILNGDSGMISRDGIRKASFYAFWFLNKLLPKMVYRDENCIVTTDGRGHYVIACHNYKQLSDQYVFGEEDQILPENLQQFLQDEDSLELTIRLCGVKDGFYQVKAYYMNEGCGNVQGIWKKLSYEKQLSRDEVEHIKSRSVPEMEMRTLKAEDGALVLENVLLAQEIRLLDVRYRYR